MELFPVIVIYNKYCGNAPSCASLVSLGCRPMVVDNSTADMGNEAFCRENGLQYISMGGNMGLPKAYNAAVDALRGRDGFVVWFDDDTPVTAEYLSALSAAAQGAGDTDIFVPLFASVQNPDTLISPCVRWEDRKAFQLRSVKDAAEAESAELLSAINSAMAVNLKVYNAINYNEEQFLDFVDHEFCLRAKAAGCTIRPLPVKLCQDYSDDTRVPFKQAMHRCDIFSKDFMVYAIDSGMGLAVARKKLFNHRLRAIALSLGIIR